MERDKVMTLENESGVAELTFDTWSDAKQELCKIARSGQEVYFRGQADARWRLVSRLGRTMERLEKNELIYEQKFRELENDLENGLLREFKDACHRIPGLSSPPENSEDEALAFAQHYSLPTRLLDWSRSPYIAAFFAFDGCGKDIFPADRNVAVWCLNWDMFELLLYWNSRFMDPPANNGEKPGNLREKLEKIRRNNEARIDRVVILGNQNRRMVYQEGLFTRAIKVKDDVQQYLADRSRYSSGVVLTKVVIRGNQQADALIDLSLMTISPVTLMSDPEGAAATAFNKVLRLHRM